KIEVNSRVIQLDPQRLYASAIAGLNEKKDANSRHETDAFLFNMLFGQTAHAEKPSHEATIDLLVSWSALVKPYAVGLHQWNATETGRAYEKTRLDRDAFFSNPENRQCPKDNEFKNQNFRSKLFVAADTNIAQTKDFEVKNTEVSIELIGNVQR